MNEWQLVWLVPVRLLLVLVFATCYVIGGRTQKWIRRFCGSLVFIAGVLGLSLLFHRFSWYLLIPSAILVGGLCLGYGGDGIKGVIRRIIYGIVLGGSGLAFGIIFGLLGVGIFQFILAVSASVYYGTRNPVDAVNEEAIIATLSVVLIPFMV